MEFDTLLVQGIVTGLVALPTVVAGVKASMNGIKKQMDSHGKKLDKIDERLDVQGNRLTQMETRCSIYHADMWNEPADRRDGERRSKSLPVVSP